MAKLDPLERLIRVLEDINTGVSDALGNEEIAMETRHVCTDSAVNALEHINIIVEAIRPFYEELPGE